MGKRAKETLQAESSENRPFLLVQSIQAHRGAPGVREVAVMSRPTVQVHRDELRDENGSSEALAGNGKRRIHIGVIAGWKFVALPLSWHQESFLLT